MKGINTITANFSNGGRQCITRKLFQYDYGQKVLIKGLTLPQSFEFHISNSNSPKASSNIFLGNNNEIIIPDEYLTSGEDIYIWIFLHQTISDGQTRYTINIPIQKRPKAESKEPTQIEQNVIDQLISSLEQKVDEISAATEQAKDTFLKYPKIVDDYWYAYNIQTKNWVNTEVKALGEDGLGIKNVSLNNDYTLTITFTDDTVFTTESIRGQKGQKGDTGVTPNLTVGTIETLPAGEYASVNIKGTAENPVLDFKIPRGYKGEKGDTGAMPNITIGTVNNLEPGSAPYVTQTGTAENPVLTFGLVKGEKGDTGEQGLQGPKGDKGDTGEQGPQGIQGETGTTGPQGEKGQKGDRGEQGIRGEQGNVGPRGQKGQTGATGPKGDTPVKGTDYWTAADKEQIIEDVLTSQDITDLKDQIDSKEDILNYSNPVQGFALTAKTIENGKVTEWDFGETGGIKMHICSSSEYSSESRIPVINNPDEKTIYLVPASYQPSNNMFTEWVYVNNTWEIFGSVAVDLSGYLTDVQINGASIVTNGVAKIPIANTNQFGAVKVNGYYGIDIVKTGTYKGHICTVLPSDAQIKAGVNNSVKPSASQMHQATFYGLAKAAGHDEKDSTLAVGEYTDEAKAAIQTMLDVPSTSDVVNDVQINGTSIVTDGVANVPVATGDKLGLVRGNYSGGVYVASEGKLSTWSASSTVIKAGTHSAQPIVPVRQHESVFYGLAKVAGDTTQSQSANSVGTYTTEAKAAIQNMLDVPSTSDVVNDVQIDEASIVTDGVANIPKANYGQYGVVLPSAGLGTGVAANGALAVVKASTASVKIGTNDNQPIVPNTQHVSTFYGLAKAAGDTTQSQSSNAVGEYTDEAKTAIQTMLDVPSTDDVQGLQTNKADKSYVDTQLASKVDDVQINGTSVVSNNIAEIPISSSQTPGVVRNSASFGISVRSDGYLTISPSGSTAIKNGDATYLPITSLRQHESVFYGLAKAAGDTTQAQSSNAVGTYTDEAKAAIKNMLEIGTSVQTIEITETNPVITALANTRYICGEITSLDFTPAASGICDIIFTAGTTLPVITLPATVKMPEWFEVQTEHTYEFSIVDGVYGAVMVW